MKLSILFWSTATLSIVAAFFGVSWLFWAVYSVATVTMFAGFTRPLESLSGAIHCGILTGAAFVLLGTTTFTCAGAASTSFPGFMSLLVLVGYIGVALADWLRGSFNVAIEVDDAGAPVGAVIDGTAYDLIEPESDEVAPELT